MGSILRQDSPLKKLSLLGESGDVMTAVMNALEVNTSLRYLSIDDRDGEVVEALKNGLPKLRGLECLYCKDLRLDEVQRPSMLKAIKCNNSIIPSQMNRIRRRFDFSLPAIKTLQPCFKILPAYRCRHLPRSLRPLNNVKSRVGRELPLLLDPSNQIFIYLCGLMCFPPVAVRDIGCSYHVEQSSTTFRLVSQRAERDRS